MTSVEEEENPKQDDLDYLSVDLSMATWVDITDDFFKAVTCLELGELFHNPLFGLFEAMSAIEMMDPKMDAGMLCNRGGRTILSFDQAVAEGYLKVKDLTLHEQITVIDRTYACMVSWLEGHSLAQTVFTNLYFQKPYSIEDRPLRAFCICIYKIIDLIRDIVTRGVVFEEEDFQPATYGYRLNPDLSDHRVVGMLREVESELNEMIHSPQDPSFTEEDGVALNARIRFTRLFYHILCCVKHNDMQFGRMGDCFNVLTTCGEVVTTILKMVEKYKIPDSPQVQVIGFEPMINQRLLPPTFPRYTRIKTNFETYQYFEQLLSRLKQVFKITSYTSFQDALNYFMEISRGNPCIVSRSAMQLLYMPEPLLIFGTIDIMDVLRDAVRNFISPPSLYPRTLYLNNAQVKECIETFFMHCIRPFTNFIQLCGHNRARQRDKLIHLLEDFGSLQDEAERVDGFLHEITLKMDPPRSHLACFSTWVLYYVLRIMVMYLLSGFELEIYSSHEYTYIYWYLNEFLFNWLISSLTRAENIMYNQELFNDNQKASGCKSRRNKVNKKKKKNRNEHEVMLYQALQSMAGAYYKATAGFHVDGKLSMPHTEFDNENVRYSHRFAAFNILLTPPLVHYNEFKDTMVPLYEAGLDGLYFSSSKQFHQARTLLESIPNPDQEVNSLLKVAKTNFVVMKVLASGHKGGPSQPLDFDFSIHRYYPVFKLN